ncbi:MAG: aldehyde dehydrogenase family protein, partial [bacterium]
MKFFLAGQWQDRDKRIEVTNPSNGEIIDSVPIASAEDVESALVTAVRGAEIMEKLTGYERFRILRRAADLITE